MKTTFTKEFILSNRGCYDRDQVLNLSFINKEVITMDDVLDSEISLKDKCWFIRKNCELTEPELREFAIGCALCVLPIYEEKYPDNKAPREAIQAAKDYLADIIGLDVLREKRDAAAYAAAAAAAYAYAYAYAAAAAAADAAYAAYAAAYADAAAAAAAYAADDNEQPINYKEILLNFLKEFMSREVVEK